MGNTLELIGTNKNFLNRTPTPIAQTLRPTIIKCDLMKLKGLFIPKGTIIQVKQQPTEWKKSFPINYPSDRVLLPKVSKELKTSVSRKQTN